MRPVAATWTFLLNIKLAPTLSPSCKVAENKIHGKKIRLISKIQSIVAEWLAAGAAAKLTTMFIAHAGPGKLSGWNIEHFARGNRRTNGWTNVCSVWWPDRGRTPFHSAISATITSGLHHLHSQFTNQKKAKNKIVKKSQWKSRRNVRNVEVRTLYLRT